MTRRRRAEADAGCCVAGMIRTIRASRLLTHASTPTAMAPLIPPDQPISALRLCVDALAMHALSFPETIRAYT